MNRLISLFLVLTLSLALALPAQASESLDFDPKEVDYLVQLLSERGHDREFLMEVFQDERLIKKKKAVTKNVVNKEQKSHYENFTNAWSIKKAQKFAKRWRTTLAKANKKFGVDPEVIVAILLVETGFGRNTGKYPVISVFSSILVEHKNNDELYEVIEELHEDDAYMLERLAKKAEWATEELDALLKISQQKSTSPYSLKGSYAGAFGMPQFLPSSYLKWGYDSDNNGSVNLFWEPDAIYSIANYLKSHGWKRGLYRKGKDNHEAIWAYNHSTIYVETVLSVAKKLHQAVGRRIFPRNSQGVVVVRR